MTDVILIVTAFLLVLMNAFFVAAEFGMVKLRHTRVATIKKTYGLRGKILSYVHYHLDAYLSACQLGITLASLGLGWIGEPAFAHLLRPFFAVWGIFSPELVAVIAFFVAFSIISFLHIVVGELMPKSLAIRQSEKVSLWTAIPLYGFYWLMYPAISLLNACSNALLKKAGFAETHKGEKFYSTDEIKMILGASHLHGELTKAETDILEHTLDFADLKVIEVMRPLEAMVTLDLQQSIEKNMQIVMENQYSRYPVLDSQKNEIVGVIHSKDLFSKLYVEGEITQLETLIRPILKVSKRLPALELLQKFQEGMPHFALVYYRLDPLGFVTFDNLLHVLIGRIKDEFHRTQDDWRVNADGSLSVRGDCPISSLERALAREIDMHSGEAETIAGYILNALGRLPKEGERLNFDEFKVVVEKMRGYRIVKLKIIPKLKAVEKPH